MKQTAKSDSRPFFQTDGVLHGECEHVCAPLDPQCIKCGADLSAHFEKRYNAFGGYDLTRRTGGGTA